MNENFIRNLTAELKKANDRLEETKPSGFWARFMDGFGWGLGASVSLMIGLAMYGWLFK